MEDISIIAKKTWKALREDGIAGTYRKTRSYIHTAKVRKQLAQYEGKVCGDVLFINGCDYLRYLIRQDIGLCISRNS